MWITADDCRGLAQLLWKQPCLLSFRYLCWNTKTLLVTKPAAASFLSCERRAGGMASGPDIFPESEAVQLLPFFHHPTSFITSRVQSSSWAAATHTYRHESLLAPGCIPVQQCKRSSWEVPWMSSWARSLTAKSNLTKAAAAAGQSQR